MAETTDPLDSRDDLQKSIEQYEEAGGDKNTANTLRMLSHAVDNLPPTPSGGYIKIWKKKWYKRFGPKTNWSMLGVLVGLAALLAMLLLR